jgi:hypothetical protein
VGSNSEIKDFQITNFNAFFLIIEHITLFWVIFIYLSLKIKKNAIYLTTKGVCLICFLNNIIIVIIWIAEAVPFVRALLIFSLWAFLFGLEWALDLI